MRFVAGLTAALALSVVPVVGLEARPDTPVAVSAWEIGPVIDGRNYSRGLFTPSQFADGWGFPIGPSAEPHYVTFRHGSLLGKRQIRMRFRIDGPPGAIVYGAKCAVGSPSAVTLYFERRGDDWLSDGARDLNKHQSNGTAADDRRARGGSRLSPPSKSTVQEAKRRSWLHWMRDGLQSTG